MCTIAMLPGPSGYLLLAGNRDEMRERPAALPPSLHTLADGTSQAIYPVDAKAGGTWIGVNRAGIAMTLLNNYQAGAIFDTHGAPRSRGLIIPELLQHASLEDINEALRTSWFPHASATFPFILIAAGAQNPHEALHASWNGEHLDVDRRALPLHSISSGFDLEGVTASRNKALEPLLDLDWTKREGGPERVTNIFAQGHPHSDAYSVAMARSDAHTVSHTRIVITPALTRVTYFDGIPVSSTPHTELTMTHLNRGEASGI